MGPFQVLVKRDGKYVESNKLTSLLNLIIGSVCWSVFIAITYPGTIGIRWILCVILGIVGIWFVTLAVRKEYQYMTSEEKQESG